MEPLHLSLMIIEITHTNYVASSDHLTSHMEMCELLANLHFITLECSLHMINLLSSSFLSFITFLGISRLVPSYVKIQYD